MSTEDPARRDRDDTDRVVSRRVDNETSAEPGDAAAYAASPSTGLAADTDPSGEGSEAERAEHDLAAENESEPERSE